MAKGKANSKKAAPKAVIRSPSPEPLFEVDTAGSSSVRRQLLAGQDENVAGSRLRKGRSIHKPLRSDQILAMRSSVPAVSGKLSAKEDNKKKLVDRKTRDKLRRMTRRDGKGQGLWGIKDTNDEREEMVTEAVKQSGAYDPWAASTSALPNAEEDEEIVKHHKPALPKPPKTLHKHSLLDDGVAPKPVSLPHAGSSYNPSFDDHQKLLATAHSHYEQVEQREQRGLDIKEKMERLRKSGRAQEAWELYEADVGPGEGTDDEAAAESTLTEQEEQKKKKKEVKRKTKQQRNRKLQAAEQAKELAERRHRKKVATAIAQLSDVQDQIDANESLSLEVRAANMRLKKDRLASKGLTRLRSGPSKVPDQRVDFQLGEELSENLRTLKPEGNLWKDWVSSEMRRGRVPVERANAGRKGGKHGGSGRGKGAGTRTFERYASKNWRG